MQQIHPPECNLLAILNVLFGVYPPSSNLPLNSRFSDSVAPCSFLFFIVMFLTIAIFSPPVFGDSNEGDFFGVTSKSLV